MRLACPEQAGLRQQTFGRVYAFMWLRHMWCGTEYTIPHAKCMIRDMHLNGSSSDAGWFLNKR